MRLAVNRIGRRKDGEPPATVEEFASHYDDLYPAALQLIRAISLGTLFKWGLRDREPWNVRFVPIADIGRP